MRLLLRLTLAIGAVALSGARPACAQVPCSSVPTWTDCCGCLFKMGQQVMFGGSRYHAYSSFSNTCGASWSPPEVPSLWALDGTCAGTPMPVRTSAPVPAQAVHATAAPTARPRPVTSTVRVTNAAELTAALAGAQPGQTILLAPGTFAGNFTLSKGGNASARIVIAGPATAILQGPSLTSGHLLRLDHVGYVTVTGITLTHAQKGLVADGSDHCLVDTVTVHNVGMEGIHLRAGSKDNIVQNNHVFTTGVDVAELGDGIAIGSPNTVWANVTGGQPDTSDNNKILDNTIGPGIAAMWIDAREGTTGGLIQGNRFQSTGMSGLTFAETWVDVKGNDWTVSKNVGVNPPGSMLADGMQVRVMVPGWGNNNVFTENDLTVNAPGWGFEVQGGATGTVIAKNNVVRGAAKGVANVPLQ